MTATTTTRYVHVAAAARELGLAAGTIRLLFDRGELTGIRSESGYRLIDIDSMAKYRDRRPLTVSEAASRLGVSRETVTKRFDAGELAGHRTAAGHRLIDPSLSSPSVAECAVTATDVPPAILPPAPLHPTGGGMAGSPPTPASRG